MISRLKKWWSNDPEIVELQEKFADVFAIVEEMELSFSKGGPVTWEQLGTYEISTPERPIGYPTGKHCMSYRLPDCSGELVFFTKCVAPPGEVGYFGWHWHPKSRETNTQLVGTAKHNGIYLPPFSITEFEPGQKHDYILPPGGMLITRFRKIR